MRKRVTIMVDNDIDKKIRQLQAKLIKETSGSVSYTSVLNDLLKKAVKN